MTVAITHRRVRVNGIDVHLAEAGDGPLVVLLHGFPELWYSWRHANIAWATTQLHPGRVRALVALSVPFTPRPSAPPTLLPPASKPSPGHSSGSSAAREPGP